MNKKTYTAQELIDMISEGWETEEELKALFYVVDKATMKNEEELRKLRESGYTDMLYDAYQE